MKMKKIKYEKSNNFILVLFFLLSYISIQIYVEIAFFYEKQI
jgi:hypothetical protein